MDLCPRLHPSTCLSFTSQSVFWWKELNTKYTNVFTGLSLTGHMEGQSDLLTVNSSEVQWLQHVFLNQIFFVFFCRWNWTLLNFTLSWSITSLVYRLQQMCFVQKIVWTWFCSDLNLLCCKLLFIWSTLINVRTTSVVLFVFSHSGLVRLLFWRISLCLIKTEDKIKRCSWKYLWLGLSLTEHTITVGAVADLSLEGWRFESTTHQCVCVCVLGWGVINSFIFLYLLQLSLLV